MRELKERYNRAMQLLEQFYKADGNEQLILAARVASGDFIATVTKDKQAREPVCDMTADCNEPITHLDDKGFIYCTNHGVSRRYSRPCRKLRPSELNNIKRGEQVKRY
jgi:hypothetical protein